MHIRAFALAALSLLGACATVGTTSVSATAPHGNGVPYYLPKVLLHIQLAGFTAPNNNVSIGIEPRYVADAGAGALTLGYSGSLFTADTVALIPNAQGLLTSVTLQSDSRAAEAFESLGTLAGSLQGGAVGTLTFTEDTLDPTNATELRNASLAFSRALQDWAVRSPTAGANAERLNFLATAAHASIGLEWVWDASLPGVTTPPAINRGDCGRGVCVRAARPGRLRVWRCGAPVTAQNRNERAPAAAPASSDATCGSSNGVLIGSYALAIPNDGPSVFIPVQGGVFADTNHAISLRNGMVREYRTVRASELEGFGTSAVGFVTAQARAVASGLETETARVRSQIALTNARADLVRAQRGLNSARTGGSEEPAAPVANGDGEASQSQNQAPAPADRSTQTPAQDGGAQQGGAQQQTNTQDRSTGTETAPEPGDVGAPVPRTGQSQNQNTDASSDETEEGWAGGIFGPLAAPVQNDHGAADSNANNGRRGG